MRLIGPSNEKDWQYHSWAYRQILDMYNCDDEIDLMLLGFKHSANLEIMDTPKVRRTDEENARLDRAQKFFRTCRALMKKADDLVAMPEKDKPEDVKNPSHWPAEEK